MGNLQRPLDSPITGNLHKEPPATQWLASQVAHSAPGSNLQLVLQSFCGRESCILMRSVESSEGLVRVSPNKGRTEYTNNTKTKFCNRERRHTWIVCNCSRCYYTSVGSRPSPTPLSLDPIASAAEAGARGGVRWLGWDVTKTLKQHSLRQVLVIYKDL